MLMVQPDCTTYVRGTVKASCLLTQCYRQIHITKLSPLYVFVSSFRQSSVPLVVMLPSSIYTIVSYLACVAASPTGGGLYDRDTLLRPSEDPFYTPPAGFENLAPGAIIRSRAPPNHLAAFSTIPLNIDVDKTRQLLFRTTDSTGNPQAAVSTIIVPQKANFSRVISYQDIPDSPYVNCATSYALQRGSNTKTTLSHTELFFEAALLDRGYVMSLPDYEGPKISSRTSRS